MAARKLYLCIHIIVHNPLILSLSVVGIRGGLKRFKINEIRRKGWNMFHLKRNDPLGLPNRSINRSIAPNDLRSASSIQVQPGIF